MPQECIHRRHDGRRIEEHRTGVRTRYQRVCRLGDRALVVKHRHGTYARFAAGEHGAVAADGAQSARIADSGSLSSDDDAVSFVVGHEVDVTDRAECC